MESSNTGTSRLAKELGATHQKEFLRSLGFFNNTGIELIEGEHITSKYPNNWSEISTMTISYGHGISSSPLHVASAFATLLNGGTRVKPTLLKSNGGSNEGDRIISASVSNELIKILYQVVDRGTASGAIVYVNAVDCMSGTAIKVIPIG